MNAEMTVDSIATQADSDKPKRSRTPKNSSAKKVRGAGERLPKSHDPSLSKAGWFVPTEFLKKVNIAAIQESKDPSDLVTAALSGRLQLVPVAGYLEAYGYGRGIGCVSCKALR